MPLLLRRKIINEWFYILNDVISILFGAILFILSAVGALAMVNVIGVFAIVIGVFHLAAAFQLRKHVRNTPQA